MFCGRRAMFCGRRPLICGHKTIFCSLGAFLCGYRTKLSAHRTMSSGHVFCGRVVFCFLVNLPATHAHPHLVCVVIGRIVSVQSICLLVLYWQRFGLPDKLLFWILIRSPCLYLRFSLYPRTELVQDMDRFCVHLVCDICRKRSGILFENLVGILDFQLFRVEVVALQDQNTEGKFENLLRHWFPIRKLKN